MSDIRARENQAPLDYIADLKHVTGTTKGGKFLLDVKADGSFTITDESGNVIELQNVAGIFSVPVKVTDITLNHQDDSVSTLDLYQLQDLDDEQSLSGFIYIGLTNIDGTKFLIKQFKIGTGEMRYVNHDLTGLTYVDAWEDRLTFSYKYLYQLADV